MVKKAGKKQRYQKVVTLAVQFKKPAASIDANPFLLYVRSGSTKESYPAPKEFPVEDNDGYVFFEIKRKYPDGLISNDLGAVNLVQWFDMPSYLEFLDCRPIISWKIPDFDPQNYLKIIKAEITEGGQVHTLSSTISITKGSIRPGYQIINNYSHYGVKLVCEH